MTNCPGYQYDQAAHELYFPCRIAQPETTDEAELVCRKCDDQQSRDDDRAADLAREG